MITALVFSWTLNMFLSLCFVPSWIIVRCDAKLITLRFLNLFIALTALSSVIKLLLLFLSLIIISSNSSSSTSSSIIILVAATKWT